MRNTPLERRLAIALLLVLPDGTEREITLEADSQAPVDELTNILLDFAGVSDPLVPTLNGVPLGPPGPWASSA